MLLRIFFFKFHFLVVYLSEKFLLSATSIINDKEKGAKLNNHLIVLEFNETKFDFHKINNFFNRLLN